MRTDNTLQCIVPYILTPRRKKTLNTVNQDFKQLNFDAAKKATEIFRVNVKHAIESSDMSLREFFKTLNSYGLNCDRQNFLYKELRYFPNLLWCATFARCLGISLHHLFDPSLPDKLASGEVVVKIQFLPEQQAGK